VWEDRAKPKVLRAARFATHEDAPVRTRDAQLGIRLATIGSMQQILSYGEGTPSSISELISRRNQKRESRGSEPIRGGGNPQDFYGFQQPVETTGLEIIPLSSDRQSPLRLPVIGQILSLL
jgi:hypothetical protein